MTLADLAAMAATVEGFVRPESGVCSGCGYEMGYCACSEKGPEWDNSPAALAMAVQQHVTKYALCSELDDERVVVHAHGRTGTCGLPDASAESIARALLTAFLRAHGVEVPGE